MFTHDCTSCHQRSLIFPGQVTGLDNTDHGIVVHFECWCGAAQTLLTGRAAAEPQRRPEPAPAAA
jgi:hypothetical protein